MLAQEISNRMERDWLELVDVAVCPPFVDLKPVKSVFEFDRVDIAVGAQNVYWEPKRRLYRRDFRRHARRTWAASTASSAIPSAATYFGETDDVT